MVKGTRRQRYISFQMTVCEENSPPSEAEFLQALRAQTRDLFSAELKDLGIRLIRYQGTSGIIRCKYQEKNRMIQILSHLEKVGSIPVNVTTQATAGTIRSLTKPL